MIVVHPLIEAVRWIGELPLSRIKSKLNRILGICFPLGLKLLWPPQLRHFASFTVVSFQIIMSAYLGLSTGRTHVPITLTFKTTSLVSDIWSNHQLLVSGINMIKYSRDVKANTNAAVGICLLLSWNRPLHVTPIN